MGGEKECRVEDVGYRLADNLKELSHKSEAVSGSVKQSVGAEGCLNLILG